MKWFNLVNFLINNPCEDPNVLKVILFIRKIMEIAFIAIPIVLIVLITFDFIKSVMANSEDTMKKNQKIVIKRLVYAVMLFFVMPIVNVAFSAFGTSGNDDKISGNIGEQKVNYLSCWDNAKDLDTINEFGKTIYFEANGGKIYGDKEKTCGGSSYCEVTAPSVARKGYDFYGWVSSASPVNGIKYKIGEKIKITRKEEYYYACWDELCTKNYVNDSSDAEEDSTDNSTNDAGNNDNVENDENGNFLLEINTKLPSISYGDKKQITTYFDESNNLVFVYRCLTDYYIESGTNAQNETNYYCKKQLSSNLFDIIPINQMIIPKYAQSDYGEQSTCGGGTLANKGCLPTSGAMIFGAIQNDLTLKPNVMNDKARELSNKGYKICSGNSYNVSFLVNYSSYVGISNKVFDTGSISEFKSLLKSKNALGIAALNKTASCYNEVKNACYDNVNHFVAFFIADNIDLGYVNILDPGRKNSKILNVKIEDLINSTQANGVRVFYGD